MAEQSEPVAWLITTKASNRYVTLTKARPPDDGSDDWTVTPLYAAPVAAIPRSPPREPTPEMIDAAKASLAPCDGRQWIALIWRSMYDAAPAHAEIERDAARYRFLRKSSPLRSDAYAPFDVRHHKYAAGLYRGCDVLWGESLDNAIDAALDTTVGGT